ncbi:MAG: leucine-rich repeat domain-containing protein [Treponema sp.]|nr:leucine-rich repeat domain-containing protein [Treponema sp.]
MKKVVFIFLMSTLSVFAQDAEKAAEDAAKNAVNEMNERLKNRPTLAIWEIKVEPEGAIDVNDKGFLSSIRGRLYDNWINYSDYTVIDLQNLEGIRGAQELAGSGYFSDDDFVSKGNIKNFEYVLFPTITRIDDAQFIIDFRLNTAAEGVSRTSFRKTTTLEELKSGSVVNEGTLDLFEKLKITLSEDEKKKLMETTAAFARRISNEAKEANDDVKAAFYGYVAAASSRQELSKNGTDSEILRNIQEREDWFNKFKSCASIFNDIAPFEIVYDSKLSWDGKISGGKENGRLNLKALIMLSPSPAHFNLLDLLLSDLEKTKHRSPWGFDGWPFYDMDKEYLVLDGKRQFEYDISIEIINEKGKSVAREKINLKNNIQFKRGDKTISAPKEEIKEVLFKDINTSDVTNSLFVKITMVNGEYTENILASGKINIKRDALLTDREQSRRGLKLDANKKGEIIEYTGETKNVIIPRILNDSPVTVVREGAFEKKQLTSVDIPDGIKIEKRAFYDNRLTSVVVPPVATIEDWTFAKNNLVSVTISSGVETIGAWAFARNRLTKINIPSSVKVVKQNAFAQNRLSSITIYNNVAIEKNAFDDDFAKFYQQNYDSKAGTYILENNSWTLR